MIWKTIKRVGYPYQVNSRGEIRNAKTGTIFKLHESSGYLGVLVKPEGRSGKGIRLRVHRCVAEEFLDGFFDNAHVNHKDGNKHNNNLQNLEWVTNAENVKHAIENGLVKRKSGFDSPLCKVTREQIEFVRKNLEIRSIRSFAKEFGVAHSVLNRALKW